MRKPFKEEGGNSSPNAFYRKIFFAGMILVIWMLSLVSNVYAQNTLNLTQTGPLTVTASWTVDNDLCDCSVCFGYILRWGDGQTDNISCGSSGSLSHSYPGSGTYTVQLECQYEIGVPAPAECSPQQTITLTGGDTTTPTVSINGPTSSPTYATNNTPVTLAGTASDNVGVTQVSWSNNRGGSGIAAGTTNWTASGISLQSGDNVITVTARDAAGNTGTDQITVTYSAPSAPFTITPSPGITNIVPGQVNMFSVTYNASGTGDFTATSTRGRFITTEGEELGSIDRSLSISVRNGSGFASEFNIALQPHIITRALKLNQSRIFYRRTFTSDGNSNDAEVALQIGPASGGPFSLIRMGLNFIQRVPGIHSETSLGSMAAMGGRATVPRNSSTLKAVADITYNGGGLIRAQWRVDGQVIGYVTRQLYPGTQRVSIESPDVPGLPTYDTGRHSVELEIVDPEPSFDEPVIYYFVTTSEGEGYQAPGHLELILPEPNAWVPLVQPTFTWEQLESGENPDYYYSFSIYPVISGVSSGALDLSGETPPAHPSPTINATTFGENAHTLSETDIQKLAPNTPYIWRVTASSTIGDTPYQFVSEHRPVTFIPPPDEGVSFEYLDIFETQEDPLPETLEPQEIQPIGEQSSWFPLGARGVWAADFQSTVDAQTTVIMPDSTSQALEVSEGMNVTIRAGLKNNTGLAKTNILVKLLVVIEGEPAPVPVDVSYIPLLSPGETRAVEFTYQVPGSYSQALYVKAYEGTGEDAVLLTQIQGYLANQSEESGLSDGELPADGYWIGEFNFRPTEVTNPDPNYFSGSGTIEIPFLSEYQVEFSGLKINEEEKRVTEGEIRLEFIEKEIRIEPVIVSLAAIIFRPDQAVCEGNAHVPLSFSPDPLELGLSAVNVDPEGLSGELRPTMSAELILVDPADFILTIKDSSFVRLSQNNLSSASMDGSLLLPTSHLNISGEPVEISFSGIPLEQSGGLYSPASLSESRILDTLLELSGRVVLDLSTETSPGNKDGSWKGVYVSDGTIRLPEPFSETTAGPITGLYIDGTGISGDVEADTLTLSGEVDMGGGFGLRASALSLSFQNLCLAEGSLSGNVHIPIIDTDIGFQKPVTGEGIEWTDLNLNEDKTVNIDLLKIKLTVSAGSSVSVENNLIGADLSGSLRTLSGAPVGVDPVNFRHLIIDSAGNFHLGESAAAQWINVGNQSIRFYDAFELSLTQLGLGFHGSELFFGVGGRLSIADNFAEGDAKILTLTDFHETRVAVDEIHVGLDQPGAFGFSGTVAWHEDNPVYGCGFYGDMNLTVMEAFSAQAILRVGTAEGINYWSIDGAMAITGSGIPLTPVPLSIFGFRGAAAYNIRPPDPMQEGTDYIVEPGFFGLKAGMYVGTSFDSGYTWHGDVALEISTGSNGTDIILGGESYILCDLESTPENRKVGTALQISTDPFVFSGRLTADRLDLVGDVPITKIQDFDIDMKVASDDWHFYVGTRNEPIALRVLPTFINLGASGYFGVDGKGLRAGFMAEVDSGRQWVAIFYGRIHGGFDGNFDLGFRPPSIYAEFGVWTGLEAGVGIPDVGSFEIFSAEASLYGGVRAPDPTRIWARGSLRYTVLETYSGTWSMTITIGESLPPEIQPRPWPCFASIEPEPQSDEIPVDTDLFMQLTTPLDTRITEEDSHGNRYDAIVNVNELTLTAFNGEEISIETERNSASTLVRIIPKDFLIPNRIYSFTARAEARGSLVLNGLEEDTITTSFITAENFPNTRQLIAETYPIAGQAYFYTEHPIKVRFSKGINKLFEDYELTAKLATEDGTEVPGALTLNEQGDLAVFEPSAGLNPNTGYRFELYKTVPSESESQEESGAPSSDQGGTDTDLQYEGPSFAGPSLEAQAQYEIDQEVTDVAGMAPVLLELDFSTGSYGTFKEMIAASDPELEVYRNQEDITTYFLIINQTVEPVYWRHIIVKDWGPKVIYEGANISACRSEVQLEETCVYTGAGTDAGIGPGTGEFGSEGASGVSGTEKEEPETHLPGQDTGIPGAGEDTTSTEFYENQWCTISGYTTRTARVSASTGSTALNRAKTNQEFWVQISFSNRFQRTSTDCCNEHPYFRAHATEQCIESLNERILNRAIDIVLVHQHNQRMPDPDEIMIRIILPDYPDELTGRADYSVASTIPDDETATDEETSAGDETGYDIEHYEKPQTGESENLEPEP